MDISYNSFCTIELHGISVEELEVELRRKEKELYLCSKLGLFLAQEVDELVSQRRGIVSDHTRVLLELQEYRDSRRSYLDVSDGASEKAGASNKRQGSSSTPSPELGRHLIDGASGDDKILSLHSQVCEGTIKIVTIFCNNLVSSILPISINIYIPKRSG